MKPLLASSASKMRRPKLVSTFREWYEDFALERQEADREAARLRSSHARCVRERLVKKELAIVGGRAPEELRQATREGRGLEVENARRLEEQLAVEKEKRIEHVRVNVAAAHL